MPSATTYAVQKPEQDLDVKLFDRRAIAAADSSRSLPPRAAGLLSGQQVLTVPDMQAKVEAHRLGLGIGYIPRRIAEHEAACGHLVIKQVLETAPGAQLFLTWRTEHKGRASQWFLGRLKDPRTAASLLV